MMIENIKKLEYVDKWLYFHEVPLNKIFATVRKVEISHTMTNEKREGEFFLSLKGESGRHAYYVTVSDEFKAWMDRDILPDLGNYFEVIQQQTHNPKGYLDSWLVLIGYSQILGSRWIDYKTTETIKGFFKEVTQ